MRMNVECKKKKKVKLKLNELFCMDGAGTLLINECILDIPDEPSKSFIHSLIHACSNYISDLPHLPFQCFLGEYRPFEVYSQVMIPQI